LPIKCKKHEKKYLKVVKFESVTIFGLLVKLKKINAKNTSNNNSWDGL